GIEALEECELGEITYQDLNDLYEKFPAMNKLGRILTELYYIELEERAIHFQFKTAKERYEYFLKKYSHAFHRIPLAHIASFLGITKETLSRIRS
ncbi:MAG: Crp/Fnr family transcriptional regulator, partial [Leptospira sp.]|nr:Crp/Fnr family transcriptional regulator [Leptospira sp.]